MNNLFRNEYKDYKNKYNEFEKTEININRKYIKNKWRFIDI